METATEQGGGGERGEDGREGIGATKERAGRPLDSRRGRRRYDYFYGYFAVTSECVMA